MHVQQIAGQEVRWELVARGHWRWSKWDIVREVHGQPSRGLIIEWVGPKQGYSKLGIRWWIYENGKRGPKSCRSLDHAQRAVANRIEGKTGG